MKIDVNNYKKFDEIKNNKNYVVWLYEGSKLIGSCCIHDIDFIDSEFNKNSIMVIFKNNSIIIFCTYIGVDEI